MLISEIVEALGTGSTELLKDATGRYLKVESEVVPTALVVLNDPMLMEAAEAWMAAQTESAEQLKKAFAVADFKASAASAAADFGTDLAQAAVRLHAEAARYIERGGPIVTMVPKRI